MELHAKVGLRRWGRGQTKEGGGGEEEGEKMDKKKGERCRGGEKGREG